MSEKKYIKTVDSHCHPQFPQYENDRELVLGRAREAGVGLICVGTDLETSKQGIELASTNDFVWATVGLHPNDALDEEFELSVYENLLKTPKVVAVGEIGLDYYRTTDVNQLTNQRKRFEKQLNMTVLAGMPVILHSRDAGQGSTGVVHPDMLSILKNNLPTRRGVAHSFTGTIQESKEYLDLGFYLGFNGIITFARQYDDLVKYVPLDKILIETDAPFLAPEPYRGKRNEPAYVIEVAKKISELKNVSTEEVLEKTTRNSINLFKLDS